MNRFRTIVSPAFVLLFFVFVSTASAQVAFVAATWGDGGVHLLDAGLNDLSSFPAGGPTPNGIAVDGSLIYVGHFESREVIAFDFAGVEQFRWSTPLIQNLQGLTMVGNELAFAYDSINSGNVTFLDPSNGDFLRTIPGPGGNVEGLAYDGSLLWLLAGEQLLGVDPNDGAVVRTVPNAAASEQFGGTGLAIGGPNELVIGAPSGRWYRVSTADGSVISAGNNGLPMYGLGEVAIPEPSALVLLICAGGLTSLARTRL